MILRPHTVFLAAAAFAVLGADAASQAPPRPRVRDLGVSPGILPAGEHNAITDVDGVRVGHHTLVSGRDVRTGVTAIVPHAGDVFREKVAAAVWVGNGFGKAAGFLQVRELGNLETPIVLTNTLAVGDAVRAVVDWTLARPGNEDVRSVNAVVGETNDGFLNDIRRRSVTAEHVRSAIDAAATGAVDEGAVGAGTGTRAFGWKGGIGTSSRRLPASLGGWTVGALVQSNFNGVLRIDGHRVGQMMKRYPFRDALSGEGSADEPQHGSCMIVLATDAPVRARNLERLARRGILGLARTGGFMANGSGDFVIAFSTAPEVRVDTAAGAVSGAELTDEAMSPLFLAAVEAVEESIYNSLTRATTVTGHQGRTVPALPIDTLRAIIAGHEPHHDH